jgi:hypothetical protein
MMKNKTVIVTCKTKVIYMFTVIIIIIAAIIDQIIIIITILQIIILSRGKSITMLVYT